MRAADGELRDAVVDGGMAGERASKRRRGRSQQAPEDNSDSRVHQLGLMVEAAVEVEVEAVFGSAGPVGTSLRIVDR